MMALVRIISQTLGTLNGVPGKIFGQPMALFWEEIRHGQMSVIMPVEATMIEEAPGGR